MQIDADEEVAPNPEDQILRDLENLPQFPHPFLADAMGELFSLQQRLQPNLHDPTPVNWVQMNIYFQLFCLCQPVGTIALMISPNQAFQILFHNPDFLSHFMRDIMMENASIRLAQDAFNLSLLTNLRREHSVILYLFSFTDTNATFRTIDFRIFI